MAMLDEWLKYVRNTPYKEITIEDRVYLEIRLSGWLAAIEHSLGLLDSCRLQPVNCPRVLSCLLSIEEKDSDKHIGQKEIIRLNTPELLDYGFNYISKKEKIELKVKRLIRKIRHR